MVTVIDEMECDLFEIEIVKVDLIVVAVDE